LELLSNYSDL